MVEQARLRIIYTEFGEHWPPVVWHNGKFLPENDLDARAAVHRLFASMVSKARRDAMTSYGRALRAGPMTSAANLLLVETSLSPVVADGAPSKVTLVATLTNPEPGWGASCAAHATELLASQGVSSDASHLQHALEKGWLAVDPSRRRMAVRVCAAILGVLLAGRRRFRDARGLR
ncbi:MAG: hypothetical protein LC808_22790 [Actinobacteria bacterium]|nr:hypothetical protein [Actinomycetota bacterium]